MIISISSKQHSGCHLRLLQLASGFPFIMYWFLQIVFLQKETAFRTFRYLVSSLTRLSSQSGALQLAPSYRAFLGSLLPPFGTRNFSLTLQEMPLQ